MDIQMKIMDGMTTTKIVTHKFPKVKIIALSQFEDAFHAINMFENGAKGYIIKTSGIDEINKAIETVINDNIYYSAEIKNIMDNYFLKGNTQAQDFTFSKRELELLKLICSGKSDIKIAIELSISSRTVEWHRRNIFIKTQTKGVAELMHYAIGKGLYFPQ